MADRAGVSVSSVFRNFDGLADLQRQALDQFHSRYSHFASARPAPGADLVSRIGFFVRTRVGLYEQAGQLLMLARFRALDHETMAEAVAYNRAALAAQTRECFRAEIAGRTVADASDLPGGVRADDQNPSPLSPTNQPIVAVGAAGVHRRLATGDVHADKV